MKEIVGFAQGFRAGFSGKKPKKKKKSKGLTAEEKLLLKNFRDGL